MRAGRELLDARPAGAQAVPDPTQWPYGREVPAPQPLCVGEGPRVALGLPEVERIRGKQQRRQGELRQRLSPFSLPPGEEREWRQKREAGRPGQQREPRRAAGEQELAPLSEHERRQGQQ